MRQTSLCTFCRAAIWLPPTFVILHPEIAYTWKIFLDALSLFRFCLIKSLFIRHHVAWVLNVSFAQHPLKKPLVSAFLLFLVTTSPESGLLAFLSCVFSKFQPIGLRWLVTVLNVWGSQPALITCFHDNTQAQMLMPIINVRLGTSSAIKWFKRSLLPKNPLASCLRWNWPWTCY